MRKISSTAMVFEDKISFEVYPLSGIVPTEDITLEISNKQMDIDKAYNDKSFNSGEFSYLDYNNDSSIPETTISGLPEDDNENITTTTGSQYPTPAQYQIQSRGEI